MSSIIKNSNLNIKESSSYYIDPEKVKINESSQSIRDTLRASLNDLEVKINIAEKQYNNILLECDNKVKDSDEFIKQLKAESYEEAFNKGYTDGKDKLENEYNNLINKHNEEYTNLLNDFNQEKKDFVNKVRYDIENTIKFAISNILNEDYNNSQKRNSLVELIILRGLSLITDEKEVRVFLSDDDYKNFDRDEIIKKIGSTSYSLSFSTNKELKSSECILETDLGYVDISLDNLIDSICTFVKENIN